MTCRSWRRAVVFGAVSGLLGAAVLGGASPASARTVSVALPRFITAGLVETSHGIVVLSLDEEGGTLQRIDPATGAVLAVRTLLPGTPTGNTFLLDDLVVAAGSLWVSEYWQNEVLRLDPVSFRTQAVIHTGRSPSGVIAGGGSVWVPLTNDQAIERVDPGSNAVVSTIPIGSPQNYTDSPWKGAWTGSDVVLSLPATGRVAHVTTRGKVTYDHPGRDATACAAIHPVPGGYWLDDTDCSESYYRWTSSAKSITATVDSSAESPPRRDLGSFVYGGAFYTGEAVCGDTCTRAELVERDIATGDVLSRRVVPGDWAAFPRVAAGAWWTDDFDHAVLHRSELTPGGSS